MSAKILVADQSPTIHKIVAMAFEKEGMKVEGISKGEHVLEFMEEFRPDIVLADIHLPGIDGYELSQKIKNSDRFSAVRVILLTSDFEDTDQSALDISRADDTISKPFKSEEILKKVKSQLAISKPEETTVVWEKETVEEKTAVEKEAPLQAADAAPPAAQEAVIQSEFEDIVNGEKESEQDTVKQLFPEDEEPEKKEAPAAAATPRDPSSMNLETAGIMAEASEETFREQTRPALANDDTLYDLFQAITSSPEYGLKDDDAPAPKPGVKPNLIEETLSLMARRHIEEEPVPAAQPEVREVPPGPADADDDALGNRVIAEHIEQVRDRLPENADVAATLEKTVREVLGEVAPKIIRKVIQEEIEHIKKMEEA